MTDLNTELMLPLLPELPPFQFSDRSILVKFFGVLQAIENVTKTQEADTGKYTYRYADLGDVLDEVKAKCSDHGLAACQIPGFDGDKMTVTPVLFDADGEWLAFPPNAMILPREAQAYGSALTYLRRYTALTLFGIAPEDDDGAAATTAAQTQPGRRTEAERMIREGIGQMDEATRKAFVADFKTTFGVSLADLAAARHGDALTWSKDWQAKREQDAAAEDTADKDFVAAASATPDEVAQAGSPS